MGDRKRTWDQRKERIKDLFDMHRQERRGVLVLIGILLVLSAWVVWEQWLRPPFVPDLTEQRERIEAWVALQTVQQADSTAVDLFPFDPNTIGREEWKRLGLTDRQIDGVERYQEKGGVFRTKRDLGRMYTIGEEQFAQLEPYILLPEKTTRRERGTQGAFQDRPKREWTTTSTRPEAGDTGIRKSMTYARMAPRPVEINTADTTALIAMPGIGPAFARGIVKYRDMLGGFVSLDQLAEVYVLKDKPDALLKLKSLLILDPQAVLRIPINTCTEEELAAHPYARWKVAKPLIAYRSQHGPFTDVTAIRGCAVISEEVFRKLAPYLSVE